MKSAVVLLLLAVCAYGGVVAENLNIPEVSVKEEEVAKFTAEVRLRFLFFFHKHRCNGALIDGEFILVPAQCVKSKPWYASFQVVVGSSAYSVKKIIIHENADKITNDIAVIHLTSTVSYSETVLPINLPFADAEHTDSATLYKREKSGKVVATQLTVKSRSDCTGTPSPLTVGHICAGDSTNSAFKGDEGSVLAVHDGTVGNVMIGMVSFAKSEPAPAVFTKISHHTNWILNQLMESSS